MKIHEPYKKEILIHSLSPYLRAILEASQSADHPASDVTHMVSKFNFLVYKITFTLLKFIFKKKILTHIVSILGKQFHTEIRYIILVYILK